MSNYIENINQKIDWGNVFVRTGQFPLDRSSIFGSYLDAEKYAKGDGSDERGLGLTSYIGQIITVYENDVVTICKINADRTLENLVASSKAIEIESWINELKNSYDELVITVNDNFDVLQSKDNEIGEKLVDVEEKLTNSIQENVTELNNKIDSEIQRLDYTDADIESRLIVSGEYSCENGELKLITNDDEKSILIDLNSGYGKVEDITKNRLQLVHCDKLFANAEEAYEYINSDLNKIIKPTLFAEPMVLKYGDEKNPNIILGIGAVGDGKTQSLNNKVYFIDFNKIDVLEDNLKAYIQEYESTKEYVLNTLSILSNKIEDLEAKDTEIISSFNNDVESLRQEIKNVDDNLSEKINSNISALQNKNDEMITTFSQMVENEIQRAKQSEEKIEKKLTLKTNDTNSISLINNISENGTLLEANVKLSKSKNIDNTSYVNIINIEEDGIFAYCDVNYENYVLSVNINGNVKTFDLPKEVYITKGFFNKEEQKIIFTYNDNTTFDLDIKNIVSISNDEHNIITKNNGELFAKAELSYDSGTNTLTFDNGKNVQDINIVASNSFVNSDSDNILQFKRDGLYANVTLDYQKARNILTFDNGIGDVKVFELTEHTVVKNGYYDNNTQEIVLVVSGVDGNGLSQENEIRIPAKDLVQDLKVNSEEQAKSPIQIVVNYNSDEKSNEIYATLNLSTEQDSPLKQDGNLLYVDNDANAYKASYKNQTVSVQDALTDIANRLDGTDSYLNNNDKNLEILQQKTIDLGNAIVNVNTELDNKIDNLKTVVDNNSESFTSKLTDLTSIVVLNSQNILNEITARENADIALESKITAAESDAKDYANSKIGNIEEGKTVVELIDDAKASANIYTDEQVSAATEALNNKIGDVEDDKTVVELIGEAKAAAIAAATKIEEIEGEHITVSSVQDENGTYTYTISENDIASASALTTETDARIAADEELQKAIDAINIVYSIQKITDNLDDNVKEAYKLVDEKGNQAGEIINIYKNSSLINIELVDQELQFTYESVNGEEEVISVDFSSFFSSIDNKINSGITEQVSTIIEAIATAKGEAIATANTYTDEQVSAATEAFNNKIGDVEEGKTVVELIDDAKASANIYTDEQVSAVSEAYTEAIATAKGEAIATANTYTDEQVSAATEAFNNKIGNVEDDKTVIELIDDAKATAIAAATKIEEIEGEHITVSSVQDENGTYTYTISENDIASASALTTETTARVTADEELQGLIFNEIALREEGDNVLHEALKSLSGVVKSYSISAVTEGLDVNIKEAYALFDNEGKQVGEIIPVYKDSSLLNVELIDKNLQFTYELANGEEEIVSIDVSLFLSEALYGDGLDVNADGVVSVKVDDISESFLSVSKDGIKLLGIQNAINSAIEESAYDDSELRESISAITEDYTEAIATAKGEVIADVANKYQIKGDYEVAGAAVQALEDAKAYASGYTNEQVSAEAIARENAISSVNNAITAITADYLKSADKDELNDAIKALQNLINVNDYGYTDTTN